MQNVPILKNLDPTQGHGGGQRPEHHGFTAEQRTQLYESCNLVLEAINYLDLTTARPTSRTTYRPC